MFKDRDTRQELYNIAISVHITINFAVVSSKLVGVNIRIVDENGHRLNKISGSHVYDNKILKFTTEVKLVYRYIVMY